jgi:hypothetical protein
MNLIDSQWTPWTGDRPVAAQTQNKRRQTSMSRVGFEPTNPVFKQAKTFYTLDSATTMIGCKLILPHTNSHMLEVSYT